MAHSFVKNAIRTLHVEFTSRCNLLCLQCARTNNERVLETLPIRDLEPKTLNKALTEFRRAGSKIEEIHACGNYGDFSMCRNFFDHLAVIKENDIKELRLYSNGSAQGSDFWSNLATLGKGTVLTTFSIDGLRDTNQIYRRGANWDSIMRNAESYISHGGLAIWEMLVFEHNEHQIDEARLLAEKMGFQSFRLKYPNRFSTVPIAGLRRASIPQPIENHKPDISCKYSQEKWTYLSFEGDIFPCCWMAGKKYKLRQEKNEVWKLFEVYGQDFLNVGVRSIDDIFNHSFFTEYLALSWEKQPLKVCTEKCSNTDRKADKYKPLF